ncbi:unnamed protein product, partial [Amoebophrya sp. A25]|eukprot:GSA25T00001112001.1
MKNRYIANAYQILDRAHGSSGLLSSDVVLGEPRPSPRMVGDIQLKRTSAINIALIELAKRSPVVLFPGDNCGPNPPPVCFRSGAENPDVFFTTAVWLVPNFARFISEKKTDYKTASSATSGTG